MSLLLMSSVRDAVAAPPPASSNYALGIEHPQDVGEWANNYDPLTYEPAVPSEWPTAESTGDYFIDNSHASATDTANTYGYPDKPRVTPPSGSLSAGNTVRFGNFSGSASYSGSWQVGGVGTGANPIFIDGNYSGTPVLINDNFGIVPPAGTRHTIFNGFARFNRSDDFSVAQGGIEYLTVRNWQCTGDNITDPNNKASFAIAGTSGSPNSYLCYYNNTVTGIGTYTNRDQLAFVPTIHISEVWIIGNTSHTIAGDSIRVGEHSTAGNLGADRGHHIYVAKNTFGNNEENPFDVKQCRDVVFSENTMYTANTGSGDPGVLGPIHQYCERIWVIFNKINDGVSGVSITTDSGDVGEVYFIGNEIWNVYGQGAEGQDDGIAFQNRSQITTSTTSYVLNNTFYEYSRGVKQSQSASLNTTVVGNIFAGRLAVGGGLKNDVHYDGSGGGNGEVLDHNLYEDPIITVNDISYTSLATLPGTHEDNGAEGNPLFTNAASQDFSLQAGSAAIGVGINSAAEAIYDLYETTFGVSIKFDINGNPRPTSIADWDAGANERT